MYKINVLGIGPGSNKYVLPIAADIMRGADVIIAAKRHLSDLKIRDKIIMEIKDNIDDIIKFIKYNDDKTIAVLVSGDTGFYSILTRLSKHFKSDELNVVPGISSFQYLFAQLGRTWENVYFTSVHGKEIDDILAAVLIHDTVFTLCDNKNTPQKIALYLLENGIKGKKFTIGERLSYKDEKIYTLSIDDAGKYVAKNICVVIIEDE